MRHLTPVIVSVFLVFSPATPSGFAAVADEEVSGATPLLLSKSPGGAWLGFSRNGDVVLSGRISTRSARLIFSRLSTKTVRSVRLPVTGLGGGEAALSGNGNWFAYHVGVPTGRREGRYPVVSVTAYLVNTANRKVRRFPRTRIHALSETGRFMLVQRIDDYVDRGRLAIGRGPAIQRTAIVDRQTNRRTPGPRVRRTRKMIYILGSSIAEARLGANGQRVAYGVRIWSKGDGRYYAFRRGVGTTSLGPYAGHPSASPDARTVLLTGSDRGLTMFRDGRNQARLLPARSTSVQSAAVGAGEDAPVYVACKEPVEGGFGDRSTLYSFDVSRRRWAQVMSIDKSGASINDLRVAGPDTVRYRGFGVYGNTGGNAGIWQVATSTSQPLGRNAPEDCVLPW